LKMSVRRRSCWIVVDSASTSVAASSKHELAYRATLGRVGTEG